MGKPPRPRADSPRTGNNDQCPSPAVGPYRSVRAHGHICRMGKDPSAGTWALKRNAGSRPQPPIQTGIHTSPNVESYQLHRRDSRWPRIRFVIMKLGVVIAGVSLILAFLTACEESAPVPLAGDREGKSIGDTVPTSAPGTATQRPAATTQPPLEGPKVDPDLGGMVRIGPLRQSAPVDTSIVV